MTQIGFIGLGKMGLPMAINLIKAGHAVRGFDMVSASLAEFASAGGEATASVGEAAAGADIIVTMLPAGSHVRDVLTGPGGVFDRAMAGALLIDSSTIDVRTSREMAAAAAARGFGMLDAPVSGGTTGAVAGTLTFMVGGEPADFERARSVIGAMGKVIVHAGASGAGQAAKVCNNLILGIAMAGVSEAFALADKLGLNHQALFDIASTSSGQCWALSTYCPVPGPVPTSPANRDYAPGFAVDLMLKDLTLATDAEAETGAVSILGGAAREVYAKLSQLGFGNRDFSVVARALLDGSFSR